MSRVRHPCAGMTAAQRAAFESIATQSGGRIAAHPKTIAALIAKGVIARDRDEIVGRDRFGAIAIPNYYVPTPVHMQWCSWCAENCDEVTP